MEEEAAAFGAALLHGAGQISGQRRMLVHVPCGGEDRDADALAVGHDEMPERHDHRLVPHLQVGVEVAPALTGMRGTAGGEHRFAILFGHGGERQHFEAVHRHGGICIQLASVCGVTRLDMQ